MDLLRPPPFRYPFFPSWLKLIVNDPAFTLNMFQLHGQEFVHLFEGNVTQNFIHFIIMSKKVMVYECCIFFVSNYCATENLS